MKDVKNIILSFDLDNTLINNRKGIVKSFNYALNNFNHPKMKKNEIEKMIGIPLDKMFEKVSDFNPKLLSSVFREYYGKKGIFQAKLLSGVRQKLDELKSYNLMLGIITSKKQEMAVNVIKYLKIFSYFDYIIGESEQIKSKLDPNLQNYFLKNYPDYKIVIIGDHPKDKALAETLNSPFIGVLTGHHNAEELSENSIVKTHIIKSVRELTIEIIESVI